jgi:hypothetical protein
VDGFSLLVSPTMYWIRMIRATSPPAARPTGLSKCSGQMTHPAYTSPPQMIALANAPRALNSSRIAVTSFSSSFARNGYQPVAGLFIVRIETIVAVKVHGSEARGFQ